MSELRNGACAYFAARASATARQAGSAAAASDTTTAYGHASPSARVILDAANATEEQWLADFYEPLWSGRVPGETLDMQIMYPLSQREAEGAWKRSTLENVKEFMLEQL